MVFIAILTVLFVITIITIVRRYENSIENLNIGYNSKIEKTKEQQRGVVRGKVTEQLVPWVKDIGDPSLMRFLGSPVDLVSFENYDNDEPMIIKFIEVKTGKSRLTKKERRIRDAVVDGRVEFLVVNIDE